MKYSFECSKKRLQTLPALKTIWKMGILFAALCALSVSAAADGLDLWHWRNPLPQGNALLGVAYGNGKYVAVGISGTVLVSANAVTWDVRDFGSQHWLRAITHVNDQFVIAGNGIWTSAEGTSWTQRHSENLCAITYANNIYVAVGMSGVILTSPDGITWSDQESGTTQELSAITYANGIFVAVGGYYTNSAIVTSQDGTNWINRTMSSDVLKGVTYGNGHFLAVGWKWNGNDVSLVSEDGINWTRHTWAPRAYPSSICFHDGMFVMVGSNGIYTSPDGTTWTHRYSEEGNSLNSIARVGNTFVALGNAGAIVTSSDGIDWSRRTVGTSRAIYSITYGNDMFVGVGNNGAILTSPNGILWDCAVHEDIDWFQDVTFGNGLFVALGRDDQKTIALTSLNGIHWNQQEILASNFVFSITYSEGVFAAVGGDGYGQTGAILISTNATDWITRSVPTTNALYSIAAGNGLFVAVGAKGTILNSLDGGATWSIQNSGVTNNLYAVGFGNGTFVTADYLAGSLTSTNGALWTLHPPPFPPRGLHLFYAITYGNGMFVAAGGNGVATSTNGAFWVRRSLPTFERLNDVVYAQNRFIVVGEWGVLLQSGYSGRPIISNRYSVPGGFGFSVQGEAGRQYRIQANRTLDPNEWLNFSHFTAGEDPVAFFDSTAPVSQQFYRILEVE